MKRVYRDKKGDSPLVSSQKRRAGVVPRLHRLSTAGEAQVKRGSNADFSSIGLHRISLVHASEEM